jgi:hypothetical protein
VDAMEGQARRRARKEELEHVRRSRDKITKGDRKSERKAKSSSLRYGA